MSSSMPGMECYPMVVDAPSGTADMPTVQGSLFGGAAATGAHVTGSYKGAVTINGNQTYTIELQQGAFAVRVALLVIANGVLQPYTCIANMEYDYGFGMRRKQWTNPAQINTMRSSSWDANLPNYMIVIDLITEDHGMRDWINTTAAVRPKLMLTLQGLTFGGPENEIRFAVLEVFPTAAAIAQSVR